LRRAGIPVVAARFVAAAHRAGLPVHVRTIDDEATLHRPLDLGADGIMSDHPALLRAVFAARGLALAAATHAGWPRPPMVP
jgi:glycerophosphoryl diester phosphodiesterase